MRFRRLLPAASAALLLGATLAACDRDLEVTNPNQRTAATNWRTATDALQGTTAVYAGLLPLGVYGRWQVFMGDLRADNATGEREGGWGEMKSFAAFQVPNYDFEPNFHVWRDHYQTIARANQVIANVPNIDMDPALRARLVGEAKFIRGLLYFNLVNWYGGNIPLITVPADDPSIRPGSSTVDSVYAQIERDATEAAAALPTRRQLASADLGRATRGAALALLGKARMQQRRWAPASDALGQVIASGEYALRASYEDNFTDRFENNEESLFEVQFGDESTLGNNIPGLSFPRMATACGPGFCDVRATRFLFDAFRAESTTTGRADPRLDATLFYPRPGNTERVWQTTYDRLITPGSPLTFRKYTEWYKTERDFQRWDNPINFRVIRYADVLLLQAEALNEQGRAGDALPLVNQVRARAGLRPLGALAQAQMREAIRRERLVELSLEGLRWFDLVRYNAFADLATLRARDSEFATFEPNRSALLPIPRAETNQNPNVRQNTGY